MFKSGDKETAGTHSEITDTLTDFRVKHLNDEIGEGTGCIKLSGTARSLQVFQETFVNISKRVGLGSVVEVYLVHHINHLTER